MNRNIRSSTSAIRRTAHAARRGFTLLEIIVVVTIIALLATLIAPRLISRIGQAKSAVAKAEVTEIAKQVQLYCVDKGITRPPEDFELMALVTDSGHYLKASDLKDPWQRDYVILMPSEHGADFDIVSWGANGEPGGEGDDADINSNVK